MNYAINNYPLLLKILRDEVKWFLPGLQFLSYLNYLHWFLRKKEGVEESLPFKVIGVGNLTWGGTGKTPFVEYLARKLINHTKVGVVTTGYRASKRVGLLGKDRIGALTWKDIGDESFLLKEKLPDIPLAFSRNRRLASFMLYRAFQTECVVLDDAFQYMGMKKDLEILLIDSTEPLGNRYLIPRGKLREPYYAVSRADLLIFTKCNSGRINKKEISFIQKNFSQIPSLKGFYKPKFLRRRDNNEILPLVTIKGKRIGVLSALGDPYYFEETLCMLGAKIERIARFQDHHFYTREEVRKFLSFLSRGTELIITTEKDILKLPPEELFLFPVYSLVIEFKFMEGEEKLEEKLRKIIPPKVK